MIEWPNEDALRDEGREGLRLFRNTTACTELEARSEHYRIVSWPWTFERPVRVFLEDESHDDLVFVLDPNGIWTLSDAGFAVHLRSPEALEEDAWGPCRPEGRIFPRDHHHGPDSGQVR